MLSRPTAILILSSALFFLLSGCGGVDVSSAEDSASRLSTKVGAEARPVKIAPVKNLTGDSKYDDLCHYLEIKLASLLEGSGRYYIVRDEIDPVLAEFGAQGGAAAEAASISLSVSDVTETLGATYKVAVFSSHQKSVKVELEYTYEEPSGEVTSRKLNGSSSKGAWGVLAKVDRERMKSGDGVWVLDNSMLGNAATEALEKFSLK